MGWEDGKVWRVNDSSDDVFFCFVSCGEKEGGS